jgi:O-antigen ligase
LTIIIVIIGADSLFSKNIGISVVELFSKRIEGILNVGKGEDKFVIGESFNIRRASAEKAVEIWQAYPILGIGAGLTYKNKINDLDFSDFTVFAVLAEYGIIGLMAFLTFFFSLVMISYRLARQKTGDYDMTDEEKALMRVPFFIMIVLFLINFISGNNFVLINNWGPVAIVMSVINFTYVKEKRNLVTIRLVKNPLKDLFVRAVLAEKRK